jgi:anti-sigma B factor antagonist
VWYNKGVDPLKVSVTARESEGQPYALVEITGEADVTNTDELRRLLDEEVAWQPRTLIIDLSGLRFMDSSALHALLRANRSLDRTVQPAPPRPQIGAPARPSSSGRAASRASARRSGR